MLTVKDFQYGDTILLKEGNSLFIRPKTSKGSCTPEEAFISYQNDEIAYKTVEMDGEEVFLSIEELEIKKEQAIIEQAELRVFREVNGFDTYE